MNLRDLRYLVAVADLRSFNQAAEQCFISQPTLSMQIKKMEESLGVVIFERNNKKVLPTELGQHIIASARRILLE
ncbi:LysR family transcriptional regulator, partial [Methylocucumis oryzae]